MDENQEKVYSSNNKICKITKNVKAENRNKLNRISNPNIINSFSSLRLKSVNRNTRKIGHNENNKNGIKIFDFNINNNQKENQDKNNTNNIDRSQIISEIKLNKFCIYLCFLCIKKRKNISNILLNEGMNIITEYLDIIKLFKKLYKEEKLNENENNDEIIGMSEECKNNIQAFYKYMKNVK